MDSITTTFYLNSDNGEDFNKKVNKLLYENPLMVIPANFMGKVENFKDDVYKKVEDRLNINIQDFVPNEDDIEIMAVGIMGTVPVVGPMMQGLFTLMSNKIKGNQRGEIVTKETINKMVDKEIAKVKNEFITIIKEKIEKSTIDQKVELCEKGFEGIKESHLQSLYESLTHLKLRLLKKDIPDKKDPLLVDIRSHFDSLRKSLKILLSISNDQVIFRHSQNLPVQIMGMYILILNNLIYHWYQYGFDPEYALGTPADDEEPATHSYREKLHINIQNFLKNIQNLSNTSRKICEDLESLYAKGSDEKTLEDKRNEFESKIIGEIDNIDKIFEADPFYYPIPLIKEYEFIKSDDSISMNKIKIQTSKKKGPCIYRIDGQHFSNLTPDSHETKSKSFDAATKCYGKYFTSSPFSIDIELEDSKDIRVRCLFGHQKNDNPEMICLVDKNKKESKGDYEVYPSISDDDFNYFGEDSKFGFFTTESYGKKNKFSLQVELDVKISKLTFCEIIVTD